MQSEDLHRYILADHAPLLAVPASISTPIAFDFPLCAEVFIFYWARMKKWWAKDATGLTLIIDNRDQGRTNRVKTHFGRRCMPWEPYEAYAGRRLLDRQRGEGHDRSGLVMDAGR